MLIITLISVVLSSVNLHSLNKHSSSQGTQMTIDNPFVVWLQTWMLLTRQLLEHQNNINYYFGT